jgi:lipopolysaccharide transport system ATP-binding protein
MSSDDIILSVQNVSKCFEMYDKPVHRLFQTLTMGRKNFYKEFWALKNISFNVRRGECVGIIGRNGAGKSTLLQIITGTLQPTGGSVQTNGRVAALLELGSGFNPEFTGRENVYMNASILGLTQDEIDQKYDSILEFADIGDFINQPVKTYSSGMMLRLAFAVIAHVDADILIVDEALSVGDAFFTQKCMRFLNEFLEKNTILFVSHDTGTIVNLCNWGILLEHGSVKLHGEPNEIAKQYLKDLYAATQSIDQDETSQNTAPSQDLKVKHDMRRDIVNNSTLRNDIEVFDFKKDEFFGAGGAEIIDSYFVDVNDNPLQWIVGGEVVKLKIVCKALKSLYSPIIGFTIKDRLGQGVFVDNTYLTYHDNPLTVESGQEFSATFVFQIPALPKGDYCIDCAVAEGTQVDHVQHQWINETIVFKSHASHALGLVGLNMLDINIKTSE